MSASVVRFGEVLFDCRSGELRRGTEPVVKLRRQLAIALELLVRRSGEVVTREELRHALWGDRIVVDFDAGLNFCIKRLREALGDNADAPVYIETLPKRGYRFIASVSDVQDPICARLPAAPRTSSNAPRVLLVFRRPGALVAVLAVLLSFASVTRLLMVETPPSDPTARVRLAVLPFANLSGAPSEDPLSSGLTDDLTTQLGRLAPDQLAVIAHTSAMALPAEIKRARDVGRELGVQFVLSGSVRTGTRDDRAGNRSSARLLVNARLVRVADESQLWTESYERTMSDVHAIQRDIAQRIARALTLKLLPAQQLALARATTLSTEAYDAYFQGHEHLRNGTEEGFRQAVAAFERAIQWDPQFAMAQSALAGAHLLLHDYELVPEGEACPRAAPAAARAMELDDLLPKSYVWRAVFFAVCAHDPQRAERDFRTALRLNPSDADAYRRYGWHLLTARRDEQALTQMQAALALDPLSPDARSALAYAYLVVGRADRAADEAQAALRIEPEFPFALYVAAHAYVIQGDYARAITALERAVHSSARGPKYVFSLGMLYAKAGRSQEAHRMLDELTVSARARYVPADYARSLRERLHAARSQPTPG